MLVTTFSYNKTPRPNTTTAAAAAASTNHLESPQFHVKPIDRRCILASIAASITPFFAPHPHFNHEQSPLIPISLLPSADARGLFQMPPVRLSNQYFLVRAGESEFESLGIINTNPVAKTSVDNGLSEIGKKQTVKAALRLKEMGACENSCWIWPSITQRAYQAAEIIAAVNGVNRSEWDRSD